MTDFEVHSPSSLLPEASGAVTEETHLLQNTLTATRVSVGHTMRLPPFSQSNPSSWFHRVEVIFRVSKVIDDTSKADQILATLPEEVFTKLTPWLDTKDGPIAYLDLKAKILDTYSMPIAVRAQRVLDLIHQPLGDTNPTEAWDELQGLLHVPGFNTDGTRREISLAREIYLRRLPKDIRAHLTEADSMPMEDLVRKARHLYDAAKASSHAATPSTNAVAVELPEEEGIYYVKKKTPKKTSNPSWCFYHNRFGEKSWRCRKPCQFPKN